MTRAHRVAYLAKNQKICDKAGEEKRAEAESPLVTIPEAFKERSLPVFSQRDSSGIVVHVRYCADGGWPLATIFYFW